MLQDKQEQANTEKGKVCRYSAAELLKMLTYDVLCRVHKNSGIPVYTGAYDLNLGFIRTCVNIPHIWTDEQINPDVFNDIEYIFFTDEYGKKQAFAWWCTTDPGLISILSPHNPKGCAILKEGYYRKGLAWGKHKGIDCLVNREELGCLPLTVIRDFDRDHNLDYCSVREETGYFGIDNHPCRRDKVVTIVGPFSEGCPSFPDILNNNTLGVLVHKQESYGHGKQVSFLLSKQNVFEQKVTGEEQSNLKNATTRSNHGR